MVGIWCLRYQVGLEALWVSRTVYDNVTTTEFVVVVVGGGGGGTTILRPVSDDPGQTE